jgi:hypothetical protein
MELSENTLNILRNFSGINQNILIEEGNTIKTISEAKNVLATAVVQEDFSQRFGVYDLNEFINALGLVDRANLIFNDEFVTISDSSGRSKVKYFYSSEETLTTPQKSVTMPSADVVFTLDNDTLNRLKKAAAAFGHNEVSISGKDATLSLSVVDSENMTSNVFSIDVDGTFEHNAKFNFVLNISNLKILPGDYEVQISKKLVSQFHNKESNIKYWIALEKSSTYGG